MQVLRFARMANNAQEDVGALWQRAIDNYNCNVVLPHLNNMRRVDTFDDIVELRERKAEGFLTSRNDGKLSRIRKTN